jgi:pyruvate formate lyase activating enzyme
MVFDIKRYAIHDGPGIRTTVFLKGCRLSCPWCHNPEGKASEQELMWWQEKCLRCEDCRSVCTKGAISFSDDSFVLDAAKCDVCGACAAACHSQALKLVGERMTVDQVTAEIAKDVPFYDESGGGVTLSGGEPLLQPDFSEGLLIACRQRTIHTAVDTCGQVDSDVLWRISRYVDLFLYDLKVLDDEKHVKFTGVSNKLILENLKNLVGSGQRIIVRFPLVPGVNDDEKDILELGEFVSSLDNVKELNILPYHKGGAEKSKRLRGSASPFVADQDPSAEALSVVQNRLKGFGLKIQIGG